MFYKLVLAILFVGLCSNLQSQIIYNQSLPESYNTKLTDVLDLPKLIYNVNEDGNLSEININKDFKTMALVEKHNDLKIARLKYSLEVLSFGEITLRFNDVILNNNAYIYVYTNDYQIVAGPIHQNSIHNNLNIVNLPARELIVEVVYENEADYKLILNSINFKSLTKVDRKNNDTPDLLSGTDSCYTCQYGEINSANIVTNIWRCDALEYTEFSPFDRENLFSSNDKHNFQSARASCIVLSPACDLVQFYAGAPGTLINLPYNCIEDSTCGTGFVLSVHHKGSMIQIVHAKKNNDTEFLDKTIVRFNWEYKYGTPWHLLGKICNPQDPGIPDYYEEWRKTIDFDEVIDYCGVDLFSYSHGDDNDFVILKMKQKPFFKEVHLGWTLQSEYDRTGQDKLLNDDDFNILGRRGGKPTVIFDNIYEGGWSENGLSIDVFEKKNTTISMSCFSGSIFTYKDYSDSTEVLATGLVGRPSLDGKTLSGSNFYNLFNSDKNHFYDECYDTSDVNFWNFYLRDYDSKLNVRNYDYVAGLDTFSGQHKWYPSQTPREKCPSMVGFDPVTSTFDSCKFDINSYVVIDSSNCFRIIPIPVNMFPDGIMPHGYRIYYDEYSEETIKFESFSNGNTISFPIVVCLDMCYLVYLKSKGIDVANLKIDFYDSTGNILNNPNCSELQIDVIPNFDICNYFNVQSQKSSTETVGDSVCCTYDITINFDGCSSSEMLGQIYRQLYFNSFELDSAMDLSEFNVNIDSNKIVFSHTICEPPKDVELTTFKIGFKNVEGCILENIYEACDCDCSGFGDKADQSWIDVDIFQDIDGAYCPEGYCHVDAHWNIPEYFNCFQFYKVNLSDSLYVIESSESPIAYYEDPANGCIPTGHMRRDFITLMKTPDETTSCTIRLDLYCPFDDEVEPCVPDCPEVGFDDEWDGSFDIDGCPGCAVRYDFQTRTNTCYNPAKQDIQVTKFEIYSKTTGANCDACFITAEGVYKEIIKHAIYENQMGFDPQVGVLDCDTTWRVINSSCWKTYTGFSTALGSQSIPPYPVQKYVPCDSTDCCTVALKVCRFEDIGGEEKISIDTLGSQPGIIFCEQFEEPVLNFIPPDGSGSGSSGPNYGGDYGNMNFEPDTVTCYDRCSWMNGIKTDNYGKFGNPRFDSDDRLFYYDEFYKVSIYDTYDNLEISVESELESDFSIDILNLQGVSVLNSDLSVLEGDNYFRIPIDFLSSGLYVITVQSNGILLKTHKIIITR